MNSNVPLPAEVPQVPVLPEEEHWEQMEGGDSSPLLSTVGSDLPICCFKFSRQELPQDRIRRHYSTGASCPLPAIVFVTTKGRQVCANPAASWVRRYLQSLEQN
ncbi:C-C motif chemokine 4 [Willisornis vidua]|uniref:C-C motif chemokine 5 n=1 Tax=Willisornis vidua TaxID=1566151 RepID=A0ABQ9D7G7_9PASS|nr:C-C motif chemokine 4 [Willisornis vidua]